MQAPFNEKMKIIGFTYPVTRMDRFLGCRDMNGDWMGFEGQLGESDGKEIVYLKTQAQKKWCILVDAERIINLS
jgi:hypothetical protein